MSISGWLHGRKAYLDHINGNKLSGEEKVKEADAKYRSALANYAKAAADKNCAPMYLEAYSVLLMRFQRFDEAMELIRVPLPPAIMTALITYQPRSRL